MERPEPGDRHTISTATVVLMLYIATSAHFWVLKVSLLDGLQGEAYLIPPWLQQEQVQKSQPMLQLNVKTR